MVVVHFFTRIGCHLCEAAEGVLRSELEKTPFRLIVFDIDGDPELRERYNTLVPVTVLPNGDEMHYRVDLAWLRAGLEESAATRVVRR